MCGSSARRDLCGGRRVIFVSTATVFLLKMGLPVSGYSDKGRNAKQPILKTAEGDYADDGYDHQWKTRMNEFETMNLSRICNNSQIGISISLNSMFSTAPKSKTATRKWPFDSESGPILERVTQAKAQRARV